MKQPCKYNIIRFQPYVETEEFANIGIILYVPQTNTLLYKLLPASHHGRITSFFDALDKRIFQQTINIINQDIQHLRVIQQDTTNPTVLYDDLVKPRDGIIRYSQPRVLLTDNPEQAVAELYGQYVNRDFTRTEGHEERMRRQIADLLKTNHLDQDYKERRLGEKHYEVRLPFVNVIETTRIIKPIHFLHPQSKLIMDHGLHWIAAMNQLFRRKLLKPENTLFAYDKPSHASGILHEAFEDLAQQIQEQGIQLCPVSNNSRITEFAAG